MLRSKEDMKRANGINDIVNERCKHVVKPTKSVFTLDGYIEELYNTQDGSDIRTLINKYDLLENELNEDRVSAMKATQVKLSELTEKFNNSFTELDEQDRDMLFEYQRNLEEDTYGLVEIEDLVIHYEEDIENVREGRGTFMKEIEKLCSKHKEYHKNAFKVDCAEYPELAGEVFANEILQTDMNKGYEVKGLGTFTKKEQEVREGTDSNGKKIVIPKKVYVDYNMDKEFENRLNGDDE